MKKSIFIILTLLICNISPVKAYEYFTIYFSDGTKSEAFYATDVDSICYSKISLDSIEYSNWQVQEIYTCDSVYRYTLAKIDSLSFKDVDINNVAENIASIGNTISPIYSQCNSTEEISTHLSEILSINGVDDAWIDNQSLFVKIKDFGTVSYLYPPQDIPITESEIENNSINQGNTHAITRAASEDIVPDHDRTDAKSICIVNQQSKDQTRGNKIYVSTELDKYCSTMGMSVKIEPHPLPNFFENEIYTYDIVILMTHGNYDAAHGLHWLATSDELCVIKKHETINKDSVADIIISRGYYNKYSTRDICYTCIPEVRNGDTCQVYYAQISNQFISKQKNKRFRNYGNVIVFNTACQSLKGCQDDAYNLAYAFGQKGARSYLGYNEVDQIGTGASLYYMLRLLNGQSTEQAFNTLPNEWKEETFEYPEKSGKKVNPKLEHIHSTNYGIISPQTLSAKFDNEIVKIMGSMKILNCYGEEASKNEYGLIYSQSPNMDDCKVAECELSYDEQTHNVIMEYTFKEDELKPDTTYYYCAYMYDDYSNCYGEIKSFTTIGDAEPYVVVNNDTITFYYDNKKEEKSGKTHKIEKHYLHDSDKPQWCKDSVKDAIFDISFKNYRPESTAYWFFEMRELTTIEHLEYLNTTNVTNMMRMFRSCKSLKSLDLTSFNTSNVTNMSSMFIGCESLTSLDLSSFNTSNVTKMSLMFSGCYSLTSIDLSSFNTSNVTDMTKMFSCCIKLKQLDLSNFNTSNVTDMPWMFSLCESIKKLDLKNFNTSKVKDMHRMFESCSMLELLDLSSFDTSSVTDMAGMFSFCSSLPILDVSHFNTSSLTDMSGVRWNGGDGSGWYNGMFAGCESLETLNLSNFDTSKVTNMECLFSGCSNLKNINLSNFVIINSTKSSLNLFFECDSLSSINFSNGKIIGNAEDLFSLPKLSKIELSNVNTSETTNMKYMFSGCHSLSQLDLSNFDTSKVTDMHGMFGGCSSINQLDLSNFDTSKVTDMKYMFSGCTSLKELNISYFVISDNVISSKNEYGTCFNSFFGGEGYSSDIPLEKIILNNACIKGDGGASLFAGLKILKEIELSNVNTSEATNMHGMFGGCSSINQLDLSNFNTTKVTTMQEMFCGCSSLTSLDLSSFNTTNVTNMNRMFSQCSSLSSLDLSCLNTFNVTDMDNMFEHCNSLTNLNLKNFIFNNAHPFGSLPSLPSIISIDVSNGKAIGSGAHRLFSGLKNVKSIHLDNFDTSEATDLSYMFSGCSSLISLDLYSFNVPKINKIGGMFWGCSSLTKIIATNWYTDDIDIWLNASEEDFENMSNVFEGCDNLVGGKGTKIGDNYYDENGETGYYHCYTNVSSAIIDGGKDNPGLFTAK